jgi:hypothetical protein
MSNNINQLPVNSGRLLDENNNIVNQAGFIEDIWDLINHCQKVSLLVAGASLSVTNPTPVTLAPKAPNQTMKTFTGTITTSTSITTAIALYTVTTGKTFYLTDVIFCNNSINSSLVSVNASASLNAAPMIVGHAINTEAFDAINIGTEPSAAGGTPVTAQAGATTVATLCTYFVAGYEQ